MKRLSKTQKQVVEVTAGASLVTGMVMLGVVIGVAGRKLFERLRGKVPQLNASGDLFSGEDPIVEAAKRL